MVAKPAPKKNLSGLKRARQSDKRMLRNQSVETEIRTYTKKIEAALSTKNKEEIQKIMKEATKVISSAASKGVIHRNTASRRISRIARKVNAALTAAPEAPPSA